MSDTKEELQRGEDFQTKWEANKDSARDEMVDQATNILIEVEHFVDEISLEVPIRHVSELAEAIEKVANLRYFRFSAQIEGKYRVYEEDFDYDFTEEVRDILRDQLGYDLDWFFQSKRGAL